MAKKLDSGGAIKTGHGGSRPGAGRRKGQSELLPDEVVDKGFATRVLERIKDLKLEGVETAEDYQLALLKESDVQTRSYNFNRLLDRKYGPPPRATFVGDTRESAPPLNRGNLPSHFRKAESADPGGTGKPN